MTEDTKPPVSKQTRTYQPTYRLNPKVRFDPDKIDKLLKRVVGAELDEIEYSDKVIPDMCLTLADTVKNAVKELNYDSSPKDTLLKELVILDTLRGSGEALLRLNYTEPNCLYLVCTRKRKCGGRPSCKKSGKKGFLTIVGGINSIEVHLKYLNAKVKMLVAPIITGVSAIIIVWQCLYLCLSKKTCELETKCAMTY